ncbi:hypothetical protein [Yoonia sp.]|uniref:hypothetical protein n=1 Tax=Yoonia sp. TaxID=2212373 RepID=UPI00344BCB11
MTRQKAADLAAQIGVAVRQNLANKSTHLIVGEQYPDVLADHLKSSKHRKAEKMQDDGHLIRIISETAFRGLLSSGD